MRELRRLIWHWASTPSRHREEGKTWSEKNRWKKWPWWKQTSTKLWFVCWLLGTCSLMLEHIQRDRSRPLKLKFYYPPEVSSMKYYRFGVFRKEYFRLITKQCKKKIHSRKCYSWVVKIRNSSEAVLMSQYTPWPQYWLRPYRPWSVYYPRGVL